MGFRRPTPIQAACIPAILEGRDVMGCAETGSGKTAAFGLPMLQILSEDPFGVFGLVLTPTRELALQIQEQLNALGAAMGVRTCLIIGGVSVTEQSLALSRRPHIVIATPGRLRHHLEGADPPNLSRAKFLVLDEADRLLTPGFESELQCILSNMSSNRQTLLFSATMTSSLEELDRLAMMNNALRFDLSSNDRRMPATLLQQYIFVPSQVKICYLVAVLRNYLANEASNDDGAEDDETSGLRVGGSVIVFASSCQRCQLIAALLQEVGIECVAMHSVMSQHQRLNALGKFKSNISRVLVATDVASRGLDLPEVDLVLNLDLPKAPVDYVHRVGRTARAGRKGRSVSIVTPQEVELVHAVEEYTGISLTLSKEVTEDDVVALLNSVAKAMKTAQLKLMEAGFDDKIEVYTKRKRKQKKSQLRKIAKRQKNQNTSNNNDDNS